MYRLISITIIFITTLSGTISSLNSEPFIVFEDGGTYAWSSTGDEVIGMLSLNDGEQVMYLWVESRGEDGRRIIYCQIVDMDGRNEYEQPEQISDDEFDATEVSSTFDNDGNMYITWLSPRPNDNWTQSVYVHKVDSQGRRLWANFGRQIAELEDYKHNTTEIYPDDHGGCYVSNNWGIIAVDENGDIREDWQWHDEFPFEMEDYPLIRLIHIIMDGTGGFWFHVARGYNRVNYAGELLWNQPQFPEDLLEYSTIGMGIDGGVLFGAWDDDNDGWLIYRLDENGNFMGDDYVHATEYCSASYGYRSNSGNILIPYSACDAGANQEHERGLIAYDPEANDLPWGSDGTLFFESRFHSLPDAILENDQGDLTVFMDYQRGVSNTPYSFDDYRLDIIKLNQEGQTLWREPRYVDNFKYDFVSKASEDGFFVLGRKEIGRHLHHKNYYLKLYDSQVESIWDDDFITDIEVRGTVQEQHLWIDNDNNYRFLFYETKIGLTMQTIGRDGNIIGDPSGTHIYESDVNNDGIPGGTGRTLSDRILYIWSARYCFFDQPHLFILDMDGQVINDVALDGIEIDSWKCLDMKITDNEEHAALLMYHVEDEVRNYYVFVIDIDEGEIISRRDLQELEHEEFDPGYYRSLQVNNNNIYWIQWTFEDGVVAQLYNFDGEEVGDQLSIDHNTCYKIIGTDIHPEGWIRILKFGMDFGNEDGILMNLWLEHIDPDDGSLLDSIGVVINLTVTNNYRPEWRFIPSDENVWVLPPSNQAHLDTNNYTIHCISPEGELLFGDSGWLPRREGATTSGFNGYSDNAGGLWLIWTFRDSLNGSDRKILHMDAEGEAVDGWDSSGEAIHSEVRGTSIETVPIGDDGIIRYTKPVTQGYSYNIQHIMDQEPDSVPLGKSANPTSFTLEDAYPNPFNAQTRIIYHLPSKTNIDLSIYDISGRELMTLYSGIHEAGVWSTTVDGTDLASGLYLLRMKSDDQLFTKKLICVK